ncbi:YlzJ-like family protein [Cohnella sp.]|uniref:YlzJ-like family protein n=1 Tax=Cohnella sp. TaxID=1883426 RepID=UPI003561736B
MTLYTTMPLELVLDGIQNEPGPFIVITIRDVTLQIAPLAPGIGRIVRLVSAPLDYYLREEYTPGQIICFHPTTEPAFVAENPDFRM